METFAFAAVMITIVICASSDSIVAIIHALRGTKKDGDQ